MRDVKIKKLTPSIGAERKIYQFNWRIHYPIHPPRLTLLTSGSLERLEWNLALESSGQTKFNP